MCVCVCVCTYDILREQFQEGPVCVSYSHISLLKFSPLFVGIPFSPPLRRHPLPPILLVCVRRSPPPSLVLSQRLKAEVTIVSSMTDEVHLWGKTNVLFSFLSITLSLWFDGTDHRPLWSPVSHYTLMGRSGLSRLACW